VYLHNCLAGIYLNTQEADTPTDLYSWSHVLVHVTY